MANAMHHRFPSYSLDQHDPPSHMLGLSSPHPRSRNWFLIAVAAGPYSHSRYSRLQICYFETMPSRPPHQLDQRFTDLFDFLFADSIEERQRERASPLEFGHGECGFAAARRPINGLQV